MDYILDPATGRKLTPRERRVKIGERIPPLSSGGERAT